MKARIFFTTLALGTTLNCAHAASLPTFDTCPARVQTKHTMLRLAFTDDHSRQYRTIIREAAKGPVNFAGHYILATWGCGAGCIMGATIDATTGRVISLPFTISDWPLNATDPLSYRVDSCLLIAQGSRNEANAHGTYYYTFDGKAFILRASELMPAYSSSAPLK